MTREAAIERLRAFLRTALETEDIELATPAVYSLRLLAPREAMGEIEAAFQARLVRDDMTSFQSVVAATQWDLAKTTVEAAWNTKKC